MATLQKHRSKAEVYAQWVRGWYQKPRSSFVCRRTLAQPPDHHLMWKAAEDINHSSSAFPIALRLAVSHTFNADFIRRFFKDWRPRLTSSAIAASAKGIQVTSFTTAPFSLMHETNWICDHIKSPRPMFLPPSKG